MKRRCVWGVGLSIGFIVLLLATIELAHYWLHWTTGSALPLTGAPPVRALVYSATCDNPLFSPAMLADPAAAALTIASAHGPSGANRDYLESLAAWLREVGEEDAHVAALMRLLPPR